MSTPRTALVVPLVSLAALLAVLTGCDASSTGEGSGNGAGQATSTGPQSSAAEGVPTETTGVPTPDAATAATLVGALRAIDPALAIDSDDAVGNAVSLCASLQDGDDASVAVASTFPDVDLDAGQQQAVAAAVTASFCSASPTSGVSS